MPTLDKGLLFDFDELLDAVIVADVGTLDAVFIFSEAAKRHAMAGEKPNNCRPPCLGGVLQNCWIAFGGGIKWNLSFGQFGHDAGARFAVSVCFSPKVGKLILAQPTQRVNGRGMNARALPLRA